MEVSLNFSCLKEGIRCVLNILGIPTPKDDISGADVARVYYEDKDIERIATYCKKDVVATAQLFLRLRGEAVVKEKDIALV